MGLPSLSSLPPSGAYFTIISDVHNPYQSRSWPIAHQIAVLDKGTPIDIMVELVVVITAKLQSHNRTSDQIAPVPFKRVTSRYAHLGIELFLWHDLGHIRVESNLRVVMSARVIHEPRKETNPAHLFLGDRIHERLNTLEKGVYPPSEKDTYMYNVMFSIMQLLGVSSCKEKGRRTHGMLTTIAFPILSTYRTKFTSTETKQVVSIGISLPTLLMRRKAST